MLRFTQFLKESDLQELDWNYGHPAGSTVKINEPGHPNHGKVGQVVRQMGHEHGVDVKSGSLSWHRTDKLQPVKEDLGAAAEKASTLSLVTGHVKEEGESPLASGHVNEDAGSIQTHNVAMKHGFVSQKVGDEQNTYRHPNGHFLSIDKNGEWSHHNSTKQPNGTFVATRVTKGFGSDKLSAHLTGVKESAIEMVRKYGSGAIGSPALDPDWKKTAGKIPDLYKGAIGPKDTSEGVASIGPNMPVRTGTPGRKDRKTLPYWMNDKPKEEKPILKTFDITKGDPLHVSRFSHLLNKEDISVDTARQVDPNEGKHSGRQAQKTRLTPHNPALQRDGWGS